KLGTGRVNAYKAVTAKAISTETAEEAKVRYVVSAKAGSEPKIWYLDNKGNKLKDFYAFSPSFMGGVNVAVGDIDNDGMAEVVAGAGAGGAPHIRIFNLSGELKYQFYAFDKSRRSGVTAAIGDTNGDGKNEIIAVEAGKTKPSARILDKNGAIVKDNIKIFDKYFTNGISLAAGDVNDDGRDEILGGAPQGAADFVRIVDEDKNIIGSFSPFGGKFYGGVNVAVGDLNNDGWSDIVLSKARGSSVVKTYDYTGRLLSPDFAAYGKNKFLTGLGTGDMNKDKNYEILTVGTGSEIKIWDDNFNLKTSFYPFGKTFTKGLNAYIVTR
ncbi:MAG: VCBS repeat-containing protein, partial [Patescibacteria group bacterium]